MSQRVHLHVGEPKTGTTYVQALLFGQRAALRAHGVGVPGSKPDQIRASLQLMERRRRGGESSMSWAELAATAADLVEPDAVISMESLVRASSAQAKAAVEAFGTEVRVVLTLRDISRVIPAQWQESVQFRHDWTYEEFLDAVLARRPRRTPAGRTFWRQHDTTSILDAWADAVGPKRIMIVTVPKVADPPDLLWRRFAHALGHERLDLEPAPRANESLGLTSAELLRRLNQRPAVAALDEQAYSRAYRAYLGKLVLPQRRSSEQPVTLPRSAWPRVAELAQQQISAVETAQAAGAAFFGEIADLRVPTEPPSRSPAKPADLGEDAVLSAALDVIATLTDEVVESRRKARRRNPRTRSTEQ